jgi:hypothetical protein
MSDYLKNLQESVILTENFNKMPPLPVLTEEDMLEDLDLIEEDMENIELLEVFDPHWVQKIKDLTGLQTNMKYKLSRFTGDKASETYKAMTDKLAAIGDKLETWKDAAAKGGKEIAGDVGEKISKSASKAAETAVDFAKDNPGKIGATVAAAAAIAAAFAIYKKSYSKAAQACKTSNDKKGCLAKFKMKARQDQVTQLERGKLKCATLKPDKAAKCKNNIDRKIATVQLRMRGK